MSTVTGLLLCTSTLESIANIAQLNAFLINHNKQPMVQLDEQMCTGKHPQMQVWGGGYNGLPFEEFKQHFCDIDWEDGVVMVVNREDKDFEVWKSAGDI